MAILDRYTHETFTVEDWSNEVLAEIYHRMEAVGLVRKLPVPGELSGGKVFIKSFGELEAYNFLENRKQGKGISYSNTTKGQIEISLDEFPDISFAFADEDTRFGIANFEDQFLKPAARAIVRRLNDKAQDLRLAATKYLQVDVDEPAKAMADVAFVLDDEGHDTSTLTGWFPGWLTLQLRKDEAIRNASRSGDGGRLLRKGEVGEINGISGYNMNGIRDGVGFVYDNENYGGLILTTTSRSNRGTSASMLDVIYNKTEIDSTVEFEGVTIHVSTGKGFEQKGFGISHDCLAGAGILDARKGVLLVPKGTTAAELEAAGYGHTGDLVDVTPTASIFAIGGKRKFYPGPNETDVTTKEEHIAGQPTPTGNLGQGKVLRNKETAPASTGTTPPAGS